MRVVETRYFLGTIASFLSEGIHLIQLVRHPSGGQGICICYRRSFICPSSLKHIAPKLHSLRMLPVVVKHVKKIIIHQT